MATSLLLALACTTTAQIPDRLSLVKIPTQGATATKLEFMDVFTRGLEGYPDFRWPHITRIPAKGSPGGGPFAGSTETLLALASGCNATQVCSSAHPWPCCYDEDEQMLMLRRSVDGGKSWSRLTYPYLQPQGKGAWPFPKNWKAGGQMLWDPKGGRVWLFFGTEQAHDGVGHGCVGDGQTMEGMMLTHSTDLGLSWAKPLNISTAIAPQWGSSLCLAPAGGNSMLMLDNDGPADERTLLLLVQIPGTVPGPKPPHGDLTIHVTSLPNGPHDTIADLQFNLTLSLTQPCTENGKSCDFDEAAMALLPVTATSAETVFVIRRSDPALTHSFATATSTDGGRSFGPPSFEPELFSVACEPSAVAVPPGSGGTGGLFVAAPHMGHKQIPSGTKFQDRSNMTVMVSGANGGKAGGHWEVLRSVYEGPSMYSNMADGGDGYLLLFFERAGA